MDGEDQRQVDIALRELDVEFVALGFDRFDGSDHAPRSGTRLFLHVSADGLGAVL